MLRTILIVLLVVTGVCAAGGGIYALAGAKGMSREWLRHTPFNTYFVPGLVLLVVVGGSVLAAAGLLLGQVSVARLVSLEAGIVLLGWIAAQLATLGLRHWLQPVSLAVGLAVVALSFSLPAPG